MLASSPSPTSIAGPPPPPYYNSSWSLISQGAEARVWLVPNYIQHNTNRGANANSTENDHDSSKNKSITTSAICKERFPKTYRHPTLDDTLTRSRTRAECRSLARCLKHGVSVPLVLGVDLRKAGNITNNGGGSGGGGGGEGKEKEMSNSRTQNRRDSACLFLEHVQGCTLRSFLNVTATNTNTNTNSTTPKSEGKKGKADEKGKDENEPVAKKAKIESCEIDGVISDTISFSKITTRIDECTKKAAYTTGVTIGKMHNANIIHGDLTTSNILIRNPQDAPPGSASSTSTSSSTSQWNPDMVLIDFGLSSTSRNTKKMSSHEERAVDLHVLERAFVTTHANSDVLVDEVMRGYKAGCQASDSVFVRLAQVRMRGRKRECFG